LTVVDFFCGAGGFSEGFLQAGFEIIHGYDHWEPAVNTYNHNFGLTCQKVNILDIGKDAAKINELPDTEVIIGSPPCVSFSSSNKSGKADKSLGLRLTETYLRIIAVKKFQPGSRLKYWLMENVPNSIKHLPHNYTFEQLDLAEWAISHELNPEMIALRIFDNCSMINSAEFGSPQARKRAILSERVSDGKPLSPIPSHSVREENGKIRFKTLGHIIDAFPPPMIGTYDSICEIKDPNYPNIELDIIALTDHFYDTGLSKIEWEASRYLKINHPYMGRMSFPEDENKPSRTITATQIGTSRESLIIKSRDDRIGDGEYRLPTVRELASIMGFPIDFQFVGGLTAKVRLVGNAVCPSVSRAYAHEIIYLEGKQANLRPKLIPRLVDVSTDLRGKRRVDMMSQRRKNPGSRFRRHPLKSFGLTVTLSNYDILGNSNYEGKWYSSVQHGTGQGFFSKNMPDFLFIKIANLMMSIDGGQSVIDDFNTHIIALLADSTTFQEMYETQKSLDGFIEPTLLISKLENLILRHSSKEDLIEWDNEIFQIPKSTIPKQQLFAMYMINVVSSYLNTPQKTITIKGGIVTDSKKNEVGTLGISLQKTKDN